MVNLLSIIFSFFYLLQSPAELEIRITGIEETKGPMMIALYKPNQKFLGKDIFLSRKLVLKQSGDLTFKVTLPEGRYAISVFHDTNSDGELNTNFLGIPKEPYGFSINRGSFGPPTFEEASFEVPEVHSLTIKIE